MSAPKRRTAHEAPSPTDGAAKTTITVDWLVRLRWGAVVGQTLAIAGAIFGLKLHLPVLPLALLVGVTVASNGVLSLRLLQAKDVSTQTIGLVLSADVVVLFGLLHFSGGPSNPFSVMYLVQITLAALVLGMRWAMAMAVLSALSFAVLFFWYVPVVGMDHAHHQHHEHGGGGGDGATAFSAHLQGMWIAFTIAATLIAYFVARVASALRAREAELAKAQANAARTEKLASLTTLAAGAAHELGTPLSTIAVASKELERAIPDKPDEALNDARLIRTEVERCREIVQRMSAQAGETIGELPRATTAGELFEKCVERLGNPGKEGLEMMDGAKTTRVVCPMEGAIQVLLNLIQNARWAVRDVPDGQGKVILTSEATDTAVRLIVTDNGVGISQSVLSRIGEPFVTTKPPGEGMGLGLFLARTFVERCGGTFEIHRATSGEGTVAILELPRQ